MARYHAEVRDTAELRDEEPATHEALAEIALAEGRALDAVREFHRADMAPDGHRDWCAIGTYANVARAFDAAGVSDSAIAYLESYVHTPCPERLVGLSSTPSLDGANLARAYRRLAELYDATGKRDSAARYYRSFIELWRNADPELQPSVSAARQRVRSIGRDTTALRDASSASKRIQHEESHAG